MFSINLKIDEIDVHYHRTGGDKPPIVLLHGLMLNGASWMPLARLLADDYDVIMPDARGHGGTSAPDFGYSYDHLAADVIGLIEALDLRSPTLLGHSMGGMTAAVVASLRPKLLQALILVEPTFLSLERQLEVYKSGVAADHLQVLKGSKQDFLEKSRLRHHKRPQELIDLFVEARFQTSPHAFQVLIPPNPNYKEQVMAFNVPCLLVIGDKSPVITPEIAQELGSLNKHLKIVQINEAGHSVPYDQLEHFFASLKTFLKGL